MANPEPAKPDFFAVTTVGERGQVVIPKSARQALSIVPGDRLVTLPSKRGNGILLMKEADIQELARELSERADHISQTSQKLQQKLHDAEASE